MDIKTERDKNIFKILSTSLVSLGNMFYLCAKIDFNMFTPLDIRKFNVKLKATIQSTGKLNFTEDTARAMELTEETYMRFGVDDMDKTVYYLAILPEGDDNSFKINKSGVYYYLPGKLLFDALGLDYKKKPIMFDLIRMSEMDEIAGGEVYKLLKRVPPRKKTEQ